MNLKRFYFGIFLLFISSVVFAQSLEFGANFASSNRNYYKNVFGGNLGYLQHFKKQFVFVQYKYAFKNNSYSNFSGGLYYGEYDAQKADGTVINQSIKLGLAQKLINTSEVCFSLGASGSLNFLTFDEEIISIAFSENRDGLLFKYNKKDSFKNRFGIGAFIDMELKQILFNRLSLFSRVEADYVRLVPTKHIQRGLSFLKVDYSSVEFMLGIRFDLKKEAN